MMQDSDIELLSEILNRARNGEITAFAVATVGQDQNVGSTYALGEATFAELLGSIKLMENRVISAVKELSDQ